MTIFFLISFLLHFIIIKKNKYQNISMATGKDKITLEFLTFISNTLFKTIFSFSCYYY